MYADCCPQMIGTLGSDGSPCAPWHEAHSRALVGTASAAATPVLNKTTANGARTRALRTTHRFHLAPGLLVSDRNPAPPCSCRSGLSPPPISGGRGRA